MERRCGWISPEGISCDGSSGHAGVHWHWTEEPHRWSGWPGAICLDCGIEDQREVCLAVAHAEGIPIVCVEECPTLCFEHPLKPCPTHRNPRCARMIDG